MRNLFLALLLANLAFAAWHFWFAETDVPVSRAVSETPTITLVEELEEAGGDEETAERCISIGPFAERPQADAVATSLSVMGFEAAVAEFADVDAASQELADPADADGDAANAEPADSADAADPELGVATAESDGPADPGAPFWIDVVVGGLEIPGAEQLQPLGLDLLAPSDADASQSPATVMSVTLRACDSAAD